MGARLSTGQICLGRRMSLKNCLVFGLVSIVVALWDSHRMLGLLGGTGLFLALAVIFGLVGARTFRGRPSVLDGTLQQLDHDQRSARGVP